MALTWDEQALKALLHQTGVTIEVAVRLAHNAGLSPARTARLLHGLFDLPVETVITQVRQGFSELQAEQIAELDALALEESAQETAWPPIALTNFSIVGLTELLYDGHLYDLHNSAEFQGLSYDVSGNELCLSWVLLEVGSAGMRLELSFQDVDYLAVHSRDPELPVSEDLTLEHLGYLSPDLLKQTTSFKPAGQAAKPEEPAAGDALLFQFQGGQAVVVHALSARVHIKRVGNDASHVHPQ